VRHIQIRVPNDKVDRITRVLDEKEIDFVVLEGADETADSRIVEFPLPTDAVGDVLDAIRSAGIDDDVYTVIGSAEAAMSPHNELLMDRYASDFDPLSLPELRSKARDLSRDPSSYYAMIALSAVIATAGLLASSPAVIVGSMVIAPFVGPILTAGVGSVTDDREMLVDSVIMQGAGVVVSIFAATLFSYALRRTFLVPRDLDILAIDAIMSRTAPNFLAVTVGLVAGAVAAYALATKGPTALIGVMIAAALIPAAATVGIGVTWGYPLLALGTLLLLVATVLAINAGVLTVLWGLGYRPTASNPSVIPDSAPARNILVVLLVVFSVVGAPVGAVTYQHVTFEREVNATVHDVLDQSKYSGVKVVGIQPQYGGYDPFSARKSVTIDLSHPTGKSYEGLSAELERRLSRATGHDVAVRLQFTTY
jgi:uncharacterized hydrophobic protein (TIGR00271 family)